MSSERYIGDPAAQARFDEAVTAHRQGDLRIAEQGYRDALAADPGHAAANNNLGLCLAMGGRLDEAVPCFRRALGADPDSVDAAANLAQALEQTGQDADALDAWRRAAAIEPQHMEPLLAGGLLGRLQALRVDPARAVAIRDAIGRRAPACRLEAIGE